MPETKEKEFVTLPLRRVPKEIMKILYYEQAKMKSEGKKRTALEDAIYTIVKRDHESRKEK